MPLVGNWDSPNPSPASECAPPPTKGGEHTRLRVGSGGVPIPTAGEKLITLPLCISDLFLKKTTFGPVISKIITEMRRSRFLVFSLAIRGLA